MAELIAVAYPDRDTASEVVKTLSRLQTEHLIELQDVVAVVKEEDGRVQLRQGVELTAVGALGGAAWGGLIGLLFLAPLLGMLVGGAAGAVAGKFSDYGINDDFMKDLGAQLKPGGSAVFVLVQKTTPDKVMDELRQYGGTVLRTSLSKEAEASLQAALQQGS